MATDANGSAALLKEWETARELLKGFDERLHDLRKYGFTFVTGLLAIEGLAFPKPDKPLLDGIKLMVLLVNFILILALRLIDRNYEVFQIAAATRAIVLERVLNLELTEVISQRFDDSHVRRYVAGIYCLFTLAILALGLTILSNERALQCVTLGAGILTCVFIFRFSRTVKVTYPNGQGDWTLERVECMRGEQVAVTLTNLDEKKPLTLEPGKVWKLETQEGDLKDEAPAARKRDTIEPQQSFTWLINTENLDEGVYQVSRYLGNKEWKPLRRKLRVRPKAATEPELQPSI